VNAKATERRDAHCCYFQVFRLVLVPIFSKWIFRVALGLEKSGQSHRQEMKPEFLA